MKGWLANHSEDSFAKAKQGQRALLWPQQRDWLPQALPRWNPSPLGLGAWEETVTSCGLYNRSASDLSVKWE